LWYNETSTFSAAIVGIRRRAAAFLQLQRGRWRLPT
jgi:hypothetical protein